MFGALSQAVPDVTPAAPFGTTGVATISGRQPQTGAYYVAVYPYPGGYGGSRASDGLVNGTPPGSMAKFMSIEMAEHRFPLRFSRYAIRAGSAGPGLHAGGCGTTYEIETLSPALVSVLGDRVDRAPFGIEGGGAAQPNSVRFSTGGRDWVPPMRSKAEKVGFAAGDRLDVASPGGGGFGNPLEREIADVEADLNDGLIDLATAQAVYGVAVAETRRILDREVYRLDPERTRIIRAGRLTDRQAG